MTWLHSHLQLPVQLNLHDFSQSALAAAIAILGVVILLELRSVVQLRHTVDRSLARVFEQLDLLRFENQQLLEARSQRDVPAGTPVQPQILTPGLVRVAARAGSQLTAGQLVDGATLAATDPPAAPIAERVGLASGEARLLASLAEARSRRGG